MPVARDIMTPAPRCIGENDTLVDAARLLKSLDVGALPICGEDRTAPFFPMLAGRATQELDWHGERIAEGSLVALDIFATHRDPTLWQDPLRFRPERHAGPSHADALIAQGAGDMATAHRCPGEPLAIELIEEGVRLLTRRTASDVPPQDLGVNLRRLPTLPRSGFVMSDIRAG